jgi:hypothetical protein
MSHVTAHIDALLNRPDTQLSRDYCELANVRTCPKCASLMRFWYLTAFNGDGDYLDSLTSYRCANCGFEQFTIEEE